MNVIAPIKGPSFTISRGPCIWTDPTPWGSAQNATRYGHGIIMVETAGHGGFLLDGQANAKVHKAWRNDGGAYEEDCDWAIVAHSFPALFTDREMELADRSLRQWQPDAYEEVTGVKVKPEESSVLREREFKRKNKGREIVTSAVNDKNHPGMVLCHAKPDGDRSAKGRDYHVPSGEYDTRSPHGFVIDPTRHKLA